MNEIEELKKIVDQLSEKIDSIIGLLYDCNMHEMRWRKGAFDYMVAASRREIPMTPISKVISRNQNLIK